MQLETYAVTRQAPAAAVLSATDRLFKSTVRAMQAGAGSGEDKEAEKGGLRGSEKKDTAEAAKKEEEKVETDKKSTTDEAVKKESNDK